MPKKNLQKLPDNLKGKDYFDKYGDRAYINNKMLIDKASMHLKIIATFILDKEYTFQNYEQLQRFILRTTRVAKRLDCYSLEQIKATLKYLNGVADYKITLETVEKYVLEDLKKLSDEEPIVTLINGEKVYDIDRLKELEKEGIIKYLNDKWIQDK